MNSSTLIQHGYCGKQDIFQLRSEGTQNGAVADPFTELDSQTITTWRVLEHPANAALKSYRTCSLPIGQITYQKGEPAR